MSQNQLSTSDQLSAPDDFFTAEFGEGELSTRLWRGGLRATPEGYALSKTAHALTNALRNGLDVRFTEDNTVEGIINDLETCWNDAARMRRACQPISGAHDIQYSTVAVSLVKHMLSIDVFQPPIVTCLINKISEMGEDSSPHREMTPLLLNQLRWLNFLVDAPALCESLLSIVPIVSMSMQKHIIEALPEILDDSCKSQAVSELIRILEETPALMGSVIDALAALGVDDERLADVNTSIIATLGAVNRDILPISIKYLLRTCPPALIVPTVSTLRSTLALPGLGPGPGKMCMDALKLGLRISKAVADHVIKTMRNLVKPDDHKPADLWLLLALYESPAHRKPAEQLFKRKAGASAFTRPLLHAALAPFAEAFTNLTPPLIALACIAVKSNDISTRCTGISLYALLFKLFKTGNTRRNVITSLIEHTGTRRAGEVDTALEALVLISKEGEDDRSVLPHSASVQGLLDYLEFFTDSQLRQIWSVLGYLCRASTKKTSTTGNSNANDNQRRRQSANSIQNVDEDEEGTGEGELQMLEILLRKELTHVEKFYRRIGVIGACTMIKVLGNHVENGILETLMDVGRHHPFSQAVAFDELAEVFGDDGSSSRSTTEYIRKTISALFERKYITDPAGLGQLIKNEKLIPAEMFGNLEGEDIDFCFSTAFLIRNEATRDEARDAVRAMVPNLRLLCVMTSNRHDGSLSEVDAIIGAPLHMPQFPNNKDMNDIAMEAKEDLLLNLFIGHGWLVELINAFSGQDNNELRAKCIKRIDNLLDIMSQLANLMGYVPRWKDVIFDAYNGTRRGPQVVKSGQNGSKGAGGKRKNGKDKAGHSSGGDSSMEWKQLSRQLSPTALSLIRIRNPITFRYTETETEFRREGDPTVETVELSCKALGYLLSELAESVKAVLGGKFKNTTAFSVTMFHSASSVASGKGDDYGSMIETSSDGGLKKLRSLCVALESLGSQLRHCLSKIFDKQGNESNESDEESLDLYRDCATLCLQSLALSLNSSVLADVAGQDMLFNVLASVRLDGKAAIESSDPMTEEDVQVAAKTAFEQLYTRMVDILGIDQGDGDGRQAIEGGADILQLEGCCAMIAAMDSAFNHCSAKQQERLGPKFSKIAHAVLKHGWSATALRLRKTLKLIPGMVRIYIQRASDTLKEADGLLELITRFAQRQADQAKAQIATQDRAERSQLGSANGLQSLTEQTCFAYTIAILEQYMFLFKQFQPSTFDKAEDAFGMMGRFIKAELPLYTLARFNQRMLGPVMRGGRTFVEIFLKSCLPYLKQKFKDHQSEVVQVCKAHQKPTRLLQTFCAHSKFVRDTSLTGLVPPLRKSLELLLYRVKEMLQSHNATDAFQLGNLKHRDIHGEVVSSQQVAEHSESENGGNSDGGAAADGKVEEVIMITDEDVDEGENTGVKRTDGRSEVASHLFLAKRRRLTTGKRVSKGKNATSKKGKKEQRKVRENLDFGSDGEHSMDENDADAVLQVDVALNEVEEEDCDEDVDEGEAAQQVEGKEGEEEEEEVDVVRKGRARSGRSVANGRRRRTVQATVGRPKSRKRDFMEDVDQTQRKRYALIDDEAGADSEDEELGSNAQYDDLSQFLLDGDEEEAE